MKAVSSLIYLVFLFLALGNFIPKEIYKSLKKETILKVDKGLYNLEPFSKSLTRK
ncbi:MAG: hypothetical protein ACO2ZP_10825 [Bacteriovoracaceae bacterium]